MDLTHLADALPRSAVRTRERLLSPVFKERLVILPLAAVFAGSLAAAGFLDPQHCPFRSLRHGFCLGRHPAEGAECVFEHRVVLAAQILDKFVEAEILGHQI